MIGTTERNCASKSDVKVCENRTKVKTNWAIEREL